MNMAKAKAVIPRWVWIDGDRFYLNTEKTALFFDVADRTLREWDEKANGTLKKDRGWWDIQAVMEWRNGEDDDTDMARKLRAEANLTEAKAAKAVREMEILNGQYLPADTVYSEWARRVAEVKSGVLAFSKKVAGQFSDPDVRIEVEKILADEAHDLLEQYSRTGKYTPSPKKKTKGKKKNG
jgi:hypothetical protein